VLSDPTTYISLLYLALVTAVGFAVGLQARDRSLLEFFLAGRGTGSIVLALSLGTTTLGAIGVVLLVNPDIHRQGPALLALAVLSALMVVLGTVVGPRYLAARVMTTPSLIAQRFGRVAGASLGAVFALLIVFVRLPMVLLGGAWVLSRLSGWEPLTTAMLILVVAGLYATAGGFPSVLMTQAMQGATIILSVVLLLGLNFLGQPLVVDLPFGKAPGLSPGSAALLALSLAIVSVWYFWADQFVVQRVLSARSQVETRRGVLLGVAFVSIVSLLGLSLVGVGVQPEGSASGNTLPGLIGSVLILSLILSAVAGMLQSAAAMITIDVVRPFKQGATDLSLVLVGRLSTTAVAVVVLLLVSATGPMTPDALVKFFDAHVAVAPPAAALFVGVLFVRRMTARGALAAMLAGAALGLAFMGLPPAWNLPAATFAVVSFALSMAVLLIFSYVSVEPARQPERLSAEAAVEPGHADAVATR